MGKSRGARFEKTVLAEKYSLDNVINLVIYSFKHCKLIFIVTIRPSIQPGGGRSGEEHSSCQEDSRQQEDEALLGFQQHRKSS